MRITSGLLVIMLFCWNVFASPVIGQATQAVPGEYIVKLRTNKALLSSQLHAFVKKAFSRQRIVVVKRASFETPSSALAALRQNPLVEVAEPNLIYHANKIPNDNLFAQLWGLHNFGQKDDTGQPGLPGVDISAAKAWDIETGSRDVVVGLIDSGVDYNNPDLQENIWTNEAEVNGVAGVDDDSNGYVDDIHGYNFSDENADPRDDNNHGTHCAGTIGARGNDGHGIAGIAWNVQIMPLKFLDAYGNGTLENSIRAIDYAIEKHVRILSSSWGGGVYSELLKQAIERAHAAGILFVVAAGNDANDNDAYPTYPSSYDVPNVLSVAAVDNRGQLAPFSSYGKTKAHVGAPGVRIFSTTKDGFASLSGTSMATPHIAGIAALLASHEPNLTHLEIKNRIITTARPLQSLWGKVSSNGIVDAYGALTNNTHPLPDPNDPTNWQSVPAAISTTHPYAINSTESFDVRVPGAKQIAIYFSKFEVEVTYDQVQIFDAHGVSYQTMGGARLDGTYSTIIDGDSAKIVLTSDRSIPKYGFDVTKILYR